MHQRNQLPGVFPRQQSHAPRICATLEASMRGRIPPTRHFRVSNMRSYSFCDRRIKSNGGEVLGFSSSTKAATAVAAAARGLGLLSLLFSSTTHTSMITHLSQRGSGVFGGIMRSMSTCAPVALCRVPRISEHKGRRMGGGPASRVQLLRPQRPAIGTRTRSSKVLKSSGGEARRATAALTQASMSARDPIRGAAGDAYDAGDAGRADGDVASDSLSSGSSTGGDLGPEDERQPKGVEGMVTSISPAAIAAFRRCPQLFFYRYILRLKSPPTLESLKGTVVHEVLSLFFVLDEGTRDMNNLRNLFREVMAELIAKDKKDPSLGYSKLFESREKEKQWVDECLDLLENFLTVETESDPDREGDPEHLELKMTHTFGLSEQMTEGDRPEESETTAIPGGADVCAAREADGMAAEPVMSLVGIVDRIDRCSDGKLRVVDYKTGKVPDLKYSEATNRRIMDRKFFQLRIYALLVQRVLGEVPEEMRLVYLKDSTSVTRKFHPSALPFMERYLRYICDDIARSVRQDDFPPCTNRLCDWCSFRSRCPAFGGEEE